MQWSLTDTVTVTLATVSAAGDMGQASVNSDSVTSVCCDTADGAGLNVQVQVEPGRAEDTGTGSLKYSH